MATRRNVIHMLAGVAMMPLLPATANAQVWPNGTLERGTFNWRVGGGDPYRGSFDHALQLAGIRDARVRQALGTLVANHPRGNAPRYVIQDGDQLGVMVSGNPGWVARNTIAWPSQWPAGASRTAYVWYWVDPATDVQYRLMRAMVCGNWLVEYYGAAEQCRCQIGRDAC